MGCRLCRSGRRLLRARTVPARSRSTRRMRWRGRRRGPRYRRRRGPRVPRRPRSGCLRYRARSGAARSRCLASSVRCPVRTRSEAHKPLGSARRCRCPPSRGCSGSLEAEPAWLTYSPGSQAVHGVQAAAFSPSLKVPLGQALQLRSLFAVACALTYCPGGQTESGAQAASPIEVGSRVCHSSAAHSVVVSSSSLPLAPPPLLQAASEVHVKRRGKARERRRASRHVASAMDVPPLCESRGLR